VSLLEAPRGPFYRPMGPRSHWNSFWKAILAFCRVAHRTVRCTTGHEQCLSGVRSPSFSGEADRCAFGPFGALDTVRCTPYSPVRPLTVDSGHVSPADYAADRWLGRLRLTDQSGAPSNSPVNFSHESPQIPESWQSPPSQPRAPDTIRCTTEQSGVRGWCWFWLYKAISSPTLFFFSWHRF
jgi:hypothetical protein